MPTYDYECQACGHAFEQFQSITAGPLRKCPECSKPKLRRLIGTGAGIIFKGSGFYETDYRSDSYKQAAKAEQDAAKPKDQKKSDGQSQDKSASKSQTKADSGQSGAKPSTAEAGKSTGSTSSS